MIDHLILLLIGRPRQSAAREPKTAQTECTSGANCCQGKYHPDNTTHIIRFVPLDFGTGSLIFAGEQGESRFARYFEQLIETFGGHIPKRNCEVLKVFELIILAERSTAHY